MNAREQYLQKQNQRLQNQVQFLLNVLDRMGLEHDFLGSVACGFAWDAVACSWDTVQGERHYIYDNCDPEYSWDRSIKQAEALLKLDEMAK